MTTVGGVPKMISVTVFKAISLKTTWHKYDQSQQDSFNKRRKKFQTNQNFLYSVETLNSSDFMNIVPK